MTAIKKALVTTAWICVALLVVWLIVTIEDTVRSGWKAEEEATAMRNRRVVTIEGREPFLAYNVTTAKWGKCVYWSDTYYSASSIYCGSFTIEPQK